MKRPFANKRPIGPFTQNNPDIFTEPKIETSDEVVNELFELALKEDMTIGNKSENTIKGGAYWILYPSVTRSEAADKFGVSGQSISNGRDNILSAIDVKGFEATGGMIKVNERVRLAITVRDYMIKQQ